MHDTMVGDAIDEFITLRVCVVEDGRPTEHQPYYGLNFQLG